MTLNLSNQRAGLSAIVYAPSSDSITPILDWCDLDNYYADLDYHKTGNLFRVSISQNRNTGVFNAKVQLIDWTSEEKPKLSDEVLAEVADDALIAFADHSDFKEAINYYSTVSQDPDPSVLHFLFKVLLAKYNSVI